MLVRGRHAIALLLGVPLQIAIGAGSGLAQPDPAVEQIKQLLQEHATIVDQWELKAVVLILLTIIVGVLGVLTGVLQPFNRPWTKIVTASIGAVVSVITIVNAAVFEADHRTFQSKARHVRQLIGDLRIVLESGYRRDSEEDRRVWLGEMREKLKQIADLESQIGARSSAFHPGLRPPAAFAAQAEQPAWVTKPPVDAVNLYFVGAGEGASLAAAKEDSRTNGLDRAVDYLTHTFARPEVGSSGALDVESLSQYLVKYLDVDSTYYAYDSGRRSYRYFTLFKLNRRFAETSIGLFAARERVKVPDRLTAAIQTSKGADDPYYQRRSEQYAEAMAAARGALPPDAYGRFLRARELRKTGRPRDAVPILNELTAAYPEFFLGWYNLALAYDDLNQLAPATRAYQKAIELEPQQPGRDASLYNSYGFFLYRLGKTREAVPVLRKALEIDPEHPKARRTLELSLSAP